MNKFKVQNPNQKARKPVFAKKSFGQNFLVDQNYIDKIISALNPAKNETIIEIGAGRGALTEKLVESGANVIAIELDRDLIPVLQEKFGEKENFKLVQSDALEIDFHRFTKVEDKTINVKLVANLPFYISTAILQKLIEQRDCFSEMILMFQREVVRRITAQPSNSERGFLTVLTEAYLTADQLFDVPPNAFRPAPKVWSSVMRLITKNVNEISVENENLFRKVVSASFLQKRKTIFNNLKNKFVDVERVFNECQIDSNRRAETLTLEEWICLARRFELHL